MTPDLIVPEEKSWPPYYTLRRSQRAKGIRLKITPHAGLEIVVPHIPRNPEIIQNILSEHRNWIEQILHRYGMQHGRPHIHPHVTQFYFPVFNENWHIIYHKLPGDRVLIRKTGVNEITCYGATENNALRLRALRAWLTKRGKKLLLPQLQKISEEYQLNYIEGRVRFQKTRWGSCSAKKLISLNHKLLFLPDNLIRYIIIHELCHTIHLNHSRRFWQLVAKFDPSVVQNRREMKNAAQYIPPELL